MQRATVKPTVCCVMLTANREELTRQAIQDWKNQTYENKTLFVFDTGRTPAKFSDLADNRIAIATSQQCSDLTVGELRNLVNEGIRTDLIAHFDSDDWSSPGRLQEQVEMIELMERDVCGYRSLTYWSSVPETKGAWFYSNPSPVFVLGGSMLYWRSSWRSRSFPAVNDGEDTLWVMQQRTTSADGLFDGWPRMIARCHGANTSKGILPGVNTGDRDNIGRFRRAPELDEKCSILLGG